ncbi:MAG: pyridoxal phosphate-dependent aminotransferase [Firmicutes bacterium]|nr:pyridoxal phosphate-dependent aminotransferase [Bacillota bacterium]
MKISKVASIVRPSPTLSISTKAKKLIAKGEDIVNFSAGEPDFDTPDNIKQAAIEAINSDRTRYTDYEGIPELRKAVAKEVSAYTGIKYKADNVVISNGSKHAIKNALAALLDPGDEVVIPAPYWNSYIDIVNMLGAVPVVVQTRVQDSYKITGKLLEQNITEKTRAIIINTPNNPTGMVYTKQELEDIALLAEKYDFAIISDEIYKDLIYSNKLLHTSIASVSEDTAKRTVIVGGFSKSYAMTGWRVGYTVSDKKLTKAIANIQSNSTSNINTIAQYAALEALEGPKDQALEMLKHFEHRRDYIAQRISDIPMLSSLLPKGAFYIFVDVSKLIGKTVFDTPLKNSSDVAKILLEKYKVAVVPSDAFGIENYIRISFATSMRDVVEGANRIEKFIKENF